MGEMNGRQPFLTQLEDNEWRLVRGEDEDQLINAEGRTITVRHFGSPRFATHRCGIKYPSGRRMRWLICELDGVRLYLHDDGAMIMTREDLYP